MSAEDEVMDAGNEEQEEVENKVALEEYRVWKKNTPFLYDCVVTTALEWPSLTVQWLPDHRKATSDKECSTHKVLLGTQSDGSDPNYIMIAEALLPNPNRPIDAKSYDEDRGEVGGYAGTLSKFDVKIKIVHEGDVHRARYMPQNPFIVATKSPFPTVLIFDYSKHNSIPTDTICRPQHRCHGHTSDGYGISWNPHDAGILLSASNDGSVCIWDIQNPSVDVDALQMHKAHDAGVEDVDWSRFHRNIYGSVGDDSFLKTWDSRSKVTTPVKSCKAHDGDVNCISFNPFDEYVLATGGSDGLVKVWDQRKMDQALHELQGHRSGVYQVSWAPFAKGIIGSSSEDRRVYLWDLERIGREQTPEEAEEGGPELLFIHGGHTAKVFDFSWNANEDWYLASVAEDNVIQIWQPAETIYNEEEGDEDVADEDLEEESERPKKAAKH